MKNKFIQTTIVSLLLTLSAQNAFAQAKKYSSNCPVAGHIKSPKDGNGFSLSEDCHTVYILPPTYGQIKVQALQNQFNDQTCQAYTTPLSIFEDRLNRIKQASADLTAATSNLGTRYSQIVGLNQSCDKQTKDNNELQAAADSLNEQKTTLLSQKDLYDTKTQVCQKQSGADCSRTQKISDNIAKTVDKIDDNLMQLSSALISTKTALVSCVRTRDTKIQAIKDQDTDFQTANDAYMKEALDFSKLLKTELSDLIQKPGGTITLNIDSRLTALVNEFNDINSSLVSGKDPVSFVPMYIDAGSLTFNMVTDGLKANIPVVLKTNIFGLNVTDADRADLVKAMTDGSAKVSVLFGAAASAELHFNLYAACKMLSVTNGQSVDAARRNVAALLLPTMTFRYSVHASRKLTIKYSESQLYKMIKESSTSNGFFTSSSSSSLTERSVAEQWIIVKVESEDPSSKWADPEKLALDIRREYLDSALMKVAKSYLTSEQAAQVVPPEPGGKKVAADLHECPNLYCQYAAFALDLGNALFGGSSSNSSVNRYASAQSEQVITITEPVQQYGTQTYNVVP